MVSAEEHGRITEASAETFKNELQDWEAEVRDRRPDLDVYWEPDELEGTRSIVVRWSLVADDPTGAEYTRLSFEPVDKETAYRMAEGMGGVPAVEGESSWSTPETEAVAAEVFEGTDYGAAYLEAVVELDHGGPGADDLTEATGVEVEDVGYGAEALKDYLAEPPDQHRAEVQRLTEDVDMSRVNWQEIYDHQVEQVGLAGDGGFDDRRRARELGAHRLEGQLIGTSIEHGEYVTATNGSTHREEHLRANYSREHLSQSMVDFLQAVETVPSEQRPEPTGIQSPAEAVAARPEAVALGQPGQQTAPQTNRPGPSVS